MLISHPKEINAPEKSLRDHLKNVGKSAQDQIRAMRLDLTVISREKLAQLSYLIGIFHDFGKATTFFQEYIRGKRKTSALTRHSFISAVVSFNATQKMGFDSAWAVAAYLIVKRHHGNLETLTEDETENIHVAKRQLEDILSHQSGDIVKMYDGLLEMDIENLLKNLDLKEFKIDIEEFEDIFDNFWEIHSDRHRKIEFFLVINLLFSTLIDADKKDAARLDTDYFDGNLKEEPCDVFSYIQECRRRNPDKFNPKLPLNRLRDQFLNEIANNPNIRLDQHFYTLTAPTGIGKTFGCLAFANRLKDQLSKGYGRMIYCLPYTSIIDQNYSEFENVVRFSKKEAYDNRPQRYLLKHHHLSFKTIKNRVEEEDYQYKDYLDDRLLVESWESAFIVTTFVQFFHTIIGYTNRFLKKFHHIVNAIVILDEVQNIPPEYYRLLKEVLHVIGNRFHTYFLLITATQPEILDQKISAPAPLIDSKTYGADDLFNRVKLTIAPRQQTLEEFVYDFCKSFTEENCLIVLNTKNSAIRLFSRIVDQKTDYRIFCLTTLLVPCDRKTKIEEIKNLLNSEEKVIVISTQLIEAGVDLSFKRVYRDFGPLDSVVQVAGRCNRNGEYGILGGKMHLIELVDENHENKPFHSYVYAPILVQHARKTLIREVYESKDFSDLAKIYFQQLRFVDKAEKILSAICDLNYDEDRKDQIPISKFKLIEEYSQESLYLLVTREYQEMLERFFECKESLREKDLTQKKKEAYLFKIQLLATELKSVRISLRKKELNEYKDTAIIEEKDRIQFISYENQRQYAYDKDIGFLTTPKTEISPVLAF
jgi:CRISPR-associated endonuclease/helicase Cas3